MNLHVVSILNISIRHKPKIVVGDFPRGCIPRRNRGLIHIADAEHLNLQKRVKSIFVYKIMLLRIALEHKLHFATHGPWIPQPKQRNVHMFGSSDFFENAD